MDESATSHGSVLDARTAVWAWTPLLSCEVSTNRSCFPFDSILELFTGANKVHTFQTAFFVPEDAAHQSQDSFELVSSERGFCTKEGKPTPKLGWAYLDVDQIILLYSGVNRGIQNFYRFTDNWRQLSRIQYILRFSLAMTLARKFKITTSQVFKRFGKQLPSVIKDKEGKEARTVSFYANQDWTKKREAFHTGTDPEIDRIQMARRMRTRSKLGRPCCICGEAQGPIVMHHVRHIRKLSRKKEATGFNRILRTMNRKQIPVCEICHRKIHRGEYDSLKLSELSYVPT